MAIQKATNVYWHQGKIVRVDREYLNRHRGVTIWFTGIPASGKSTLAVALEQQLHQRTCRTYILDGDNIRQGLNRDLGFSPQDRSENIRRIGEIACLLRDAAIINMVAFISPYRSDRKMARDLGNNDGTFIEVFVDCPLAVCEERDPRGMYQKARQGIIREFTGVSAPYEPPENPEIHLLTGQFAVDLCVNQIMSYLQDNRLIH